MNASDGIRIHRSVACSFAPRSPVIDTAKLSGSHPRPAARDTPVRPTLYHKRTSIHKSKAPRNR
ncbi:hypothetical protein BC834DRAFT_884689, partial [Gloeopeniophorella convolvens]